MFKGLQDIVSKVTHKDVIEPNNPKLTTILSAGELLSDEKRSSTIEKFQRLLSLDDNSFESLAIPLITNVALFVQRLPSSRNSYFSHKGGALDHALERAFVALSICRTYFITSDQANHKLTKAQGLWAYAVFSAALLHNLGHIALDIELNLYDRNEKPSKSWTILEGSMFGQGVFYKYDFLPNYPDEVHKRATILLAHKLMPKEGFSWLCSKRNVLATWLALLVDDTRAGGTLGPVIVRADAQVIYDYFAALRHPQHHDYKHNQEPIKLSQLTTPFSHPFKSLDQANRLGEGTQAGVAFLKWLQKNIKDETLMINKAPLVYVPGGLLLSKDIFQMFTREHGEFKSWQSVQESFTKLDLHERSAEQSPIQQFIHTKTNKQVSGIVLSNLNLAIAGSITKETMINLPQLQTEFAKVPAATLVQPAQMIAENGNFVNSNANVRAAHSPSMSASPEGSTTR